MLCQLLKGVVGEPRPDYANLFTTHPDHTHTLVCPVPKNAI